MTDKTLAFRSDVFGNVVHVGDRVVYSDSGAMAIGRIEEIRYDYFKIERIKTNSRYGYATPYAKVRHSNSILKVEDERKNLIR